MTITLECPVLILGNHLVAFLIRTVNATLDVRQCQFLALFNSCVCFDKSGILSIRILSKIKVAIRNTGMIKV